MYICKGGKSDKLELRSVLTDGTQTEALEETRVSVDAVGLLIRGRKRDIGLPGAYRKAVSGFGRSIKNELSKKTLTTVVASGYFDPLHIGHIEYLELAKALGDKLIVIVNTDRAAIRKKGRAFMPEADRMKIVAALRCVDEVVLAKDDDGSVWKSLEEIKPDIFAKGGDRTPDNLPQVELDVCNSNGIEIVCNLGEKIASSSALIENTESTN
jgi:rfaE bifunctional protein nucleotidyltransferase chain/domain